MRTHRVKQTRIDRRCFLAYGGSTLLAMFALDSTSIPRARGAPIAGGTLDVGKVPKFVTPLVIPPAMPQSEPNVYRIAARQHLQQMLPPPYPPTAVWSYGSTTDERTFSVPAATIEAKRGTPIEVTWINELKEAGGRYRPHLFAVDQSLHWANPPGPRDARPEFTATPGPYRGPVPHVTHLHGMVDVDDWSDGYAEAWYLPDASNIPSGFARFGSWYDFFREKSGGRDWAPGQATYRYPNSQRPCALWYHDHALGITRLNVYAGLAGLYLIRSDDPADNPTVAGSGAAAVLPSDDHELPLAIMDRSFNADGSLFYPDARRFFDGYAGPFIPANAMPPIWVPEFFANCMTVNGRTWPYHSVAQRRYRLRILNACNSRFLILRFSDPNVETWQIGTDGGLLRAPVRVRDVLLAPAQRTDLVVDFSRLAIGARVRLLNLGPDAPFRDAGEAAPADPGTSGQVMEFRVDRRPQGPDRTTLPAQLVMPSIAALSGGTERPLALVEEMTPVTLAAKADEKENQKEKERGGESVPHRAALGTFDPAAGQPKGIAVKEWGDPVTENPTPGETEIWAFYNFTGDAHPMHVHDVLFQLVDRQEIDDETGRPEGRKRPPKPEEDGWLDTVIAYPGEVTRIRARFVKPGQFVWHCHITEHEDNEMMRPFRIGPAQPGEPQGHSKGRR